MKNLIAALLALCLLASGCALATPRAAQTTLTEYARVENARMIDGSDLLCVESRDGCALATIDGTPLTEFIYYRGMDCSDGYVTVRTVDGEKLMSGLLADDGSPVMPCEYGDIRVLSPYWAVGVKLVEATKDNYDYSSWTSDAVYLIDTVDVYWLPDARKAATLNRDHYSDAKAYGEVINIEDRATGVTTCYGADYIPLGEVRGTYSDDYATKYTTVSENGQQGLVAPDGTVVFQPAYRYVDTNVRDGYFTVSSGDLYGLANVDGTVAVPVEYDRIMTAYYAPKTGSDSPYVAGGYVCVVRDGKLGYYALGEGESCTPTYAKDNLDNAGMSATFTDMAGGLNLLAADGVETKLEGYDRVTPMSYGSGLYYTVVDANYSRGLIDWHGEVILPCEYDTLALSGSGRYLLTLKGYGEPAVIYEIATTFAAAAPEADEAAASEEAGAALDADPADGQATVRTLLESAAALVADDPAGAAAMIESARTLLGADSPVVPMLTSALTLIDVDAAANAASVDTLLKTAMAQLG